MGEKIRDLHKITFGNSDFMIELNEGYNKSDGKLIHVQNTHFRYLLKEKDFLNLAATILRAKTEMDYIKSHPPIKQELLPNRLEKSERVNDFTISVSELFSKNKINYRLIETGNKLCTYLIDPNQYDETHLILTNNQYEKLEHPYGNLFGYQFLYQMKEFELYEKKDVFLEIYFQLPCMSLTPKTWIPLDRSIQKYAWEKSVTESNIFILDDLTYYIYRLCWAIFKDGFFSNRTIFELEKRVYVLQEKNLKDLMETVFFRYTNTLITLLKNKEYDEIIPGYYRFSAY